MFVRRVVVVIVLESLIDSQWATKYSFSIRCRVTRRFECRTVLKSRWELWADMYLVHVDVD
jgi:hypothetical protein